jgi:hypothetical protein
MKQIHKIILGVTGGVVYLANALPQVQASTTTSQGYATTNLKTTTVYQDPGAVMTRITTVPSTKPTTIPTVPSGVKPVMKGFIPANLLPSIMISTSPNPKPSVILTASPGPKISVTPGPKVSPTPGPKSGFSQNPATDVFSTSVQRIIAKILSLFNGLFGK